ncbi:MAG: Single-stranded DNA-binding protein [Microgenomates group bacterium ADurb.Bin219]|nr:MAG: Single-stranded DNA-binding protein [Microgenomates group bacterium ADurb.Bin219]HNP89331.1 single-stranded DNA-binding protein [Candidatus Woesebacteria bacterium]
MSTRSLNKVQLIGNLTRDPELRYTPQGTAVCTFGLATNRSWTTENGEKKEETEFHRIVAWNKLAELCSQLLFKGRRVFVEGRLQTRSWTGQDGAQRQATEIVIEDMIILDSRRGSGDEENAGSEPVAAAPVSETVAEPAEVLPEAPVSPVPQPETVAAEPTVVPENKPEEDQAAAKKKKVFKKETAEPKDEKKEETAVSPDDIPF